MVIDGKITASFAMVFADCLFTPRAGLAKLYADEQLIVSNVAPTRQSSQNIRFYDGSQTAVDPLLTLRIGAAKATAWPGFVYAVFEDFDCSSYGNRVPLIRAVLSGAATDTPGNEEQSTLRFGAFGSSYNNGALTVDPTRSHHYQIVSAGADDAFVCTFDIRTLEEINRVRITGIASFGTVDFTVPLYGTDYLACAITEPTIRPVLLDTQTGRLVGGLDEVAGWQLAPKTSALLESGAATKFLVVTQVEIEPGAATASGLGVFVADTTNETMAWIIHPGTNPAAGANPASARSIEFGPNVDGVATIWYTDSTLPVGGVNIALVSDTGATSRVFYTEATAGKTPTGIAYDPLRDVLVVYREDGSWLKLDAVTGAIKETVAGSVTDYNINYWTDDVSFGVLVRAFHHTHRPGWIVATRGHVYGDIHEIDLDTLTVTLLIDRSDFDAADVSVYFDQYAGVMTEGSDLPGIINRITLGGVTPDTVDLVDIFSQLATFDGRFDLADLDFSDFPGNETSGLKLENDTTVDNLEQSIAEIFDVKIVPSDGTRKYFYPARDGSFAIGAAVDPDEFVETGSQTIVKTFGAGEDEMAGCAVSYHDVDADYKKLEQSYARPVGLYDVTRSKKKRTFNTVLSLTASQAMRLATTAVYRSVLGNETFSFSLVPGKSHVEPADILEFDFRGFTVYGRVKEATLAADLTQSVLAYQYLQYADATFTGAALGVPVEVLQSVASRMIYLDVPLLSYAHDLGGTGLVQYLQLAGFGPGIINASAYKSVNGETFALLGSLANVAPVVGTVTAISGFPADPFVKDETNTITVAIGAGDIDELHTITEPEFDAGLNLAAIGRNGRWVLVWFQTVASSNGSAVLSDLMWGVRGSEPWIGQLVAGDTFVLIDVGRYTRFRNETADLDRTFFYKAATAGMPLGYVPTLAYPASGVAETPYAPTSLDAEVSGSDLVLSWDYRSRLTTGFNPANHGEAALAFEIDIMDGATVTRTLTSATNSVTYGAVQIAEDFGSMPTEITFRVYMMSALVGRGYMAEAARTTATYSVAAGTASYQVVGHAASIVESRPFVAGAGSYAVGGSAATLTKTTSGLILDGTSPTGAWSMSRDLLTSFVGGTRYTTVIEGVSDQAVNSLNDQTGNARHFTQGGSGQRPFLATAGPMSRTCADFDGGSDYMTSAALSAFIGASSGYVVAAFVANSIFPNDALSFNNDPVVADTGGYMGLYLKNTGTPATIIAFNWDTNADDAVSTGVITPGTVYVAEWRHEGGNVYIRVNGGTEVSTASGNTGSLSGLLRTGVRSSQFADMKLFELATWSTIPALATRDAIVADFMAHIGA